MMTDVDKAAKAAISPLFPCAPNIYRGPAVEYVAWNSYAISQAYAERKPAAVRFATQVHYYLPHGKDPRAGIVALQQALFNQGFVWPRDITDASDSQGQHYVLECDYISPGGVYGYA